MKKVILILGVALLLAACGQQQTAAPTEAAPTEAATTVAQGELPEGTIQAQDDAVTLELEINEVDESGSYGITGVFTNNSDINITEFMAEFQCYDESGKALTNPTYFWYSDYMYDYAFTTGKTVTLYQHIPIETYKLVYSTVYFGDGDGNAYVSYISDNEGVFTLE